ncbi:hypothetical protein U14_03612 [Candidatus Moduliflexus flocculans]|uniref:PBP domain-containing protein n=1 Tax=Candidatus Moduliflexus flocculans TaxID=1499966 RepID=A0A081BPP5_9BACT|nr:hypothetical protein U14_03612 [Candidatus Moduliflexus flocculans]
MKSCLAVFVSVCLLAMLGYPARIPAQEETGYVVIVHVENPVTELDKKEIAKIFLKKTKEWKEMKKTIEPIDLASDSPVRERFSKEVLERTMNAVKAYWQKEIFSGRSVPPVEKTSNEEVLKFVSEHVSAIGYVSSSADMSAYEKVKTITVLGREK